MIYDEARSDFKDVINSEGVECTFTPSGSVDSLNIRGLFASHHNSINTDGVPINAKTTRLTIIEKDLTDHDYVTRNSKGYVSMKDHKVSFIDASGVLQYFIVNEVFPDNTLGVITLILGDYAN